MKKGRSKFMIEPDTIRLLRECDAGIKMGVSSIDEVLKYVKDEDLKDYLETCMHEHEDIKHELQEMLDSYGDEGKDPNPVAKGMSWLKTNVKLMVNESDGAIASLITDGCNMGVKSLSEYLNQYENADKQSQKIAKKLIGLEEKLVTDIREFL